MDYEVRSKGKIKPRRRYAPEFKQKVLRECDEGKESVAAISLKYGLNHNLVHKWRYLQRQSGGSKFVQLPMPKPTSPLIECEYHAVDTSGVLGRTFRGPRKGYSVNSSRYKSTLNRAIALAQSIVISQNQRNIVYLDLL